MEDDQSLVNLNSRTSFPVLPFERVKFVSANESVPDVAGPSTSSKLSNELDGVEVSNFYKTVISGPSTYKSKKSTVPSSRPCIRISKNIIFNKNDNDFFRYVQEGKVEEVMQFIEDGFDCDKIDQYGWTPLMIAACAGQQPMIEYLLKAGADIEMRNPQGLSASDLAKKQNFSTQILKYLDPIYGRIVTMKVEPEQIQEQRMEKFCNVCKKTYEDNKYDHERSIAHLFNCSRKSKNSTFYHIPECNKGFQIMLREGWDKDKGLGPTGEGQKYPVKTVLRGDRSCIGTAQKNVPRITHFQPYDVSAVKRISEIKKPAIERERTLKKRERQKIERKQRQKEINFRREFYS